jgi:hypothetical protein
MKFIVSIILTALLSFAACLFMPWWSIALAAFVTAAAVPQRPAKSFLSGFIALLLLWGGLSFYISNANNHMLAHKVSVVLIKTDNPYYLIAATALVGALVGGLSALTGSFVRKKS